MNLEFFKNAHIVFYTLILNEQEVSQNKALQTSQNEILLNTQTSQNSQNELLSDFLENKICNLLNLPLDNEYFFQYTLAHDLSAYHCVLVNKESLKECVKNADSYLSNPCFLCAQFVENTLKYQFFLILDTFLEWSLVGFSSGKIVFLQTLAQENIMPKLEQCKKDYGDFSLSIWCLGDLVADSKANFDGNSNGADSNGDLNGEAANFNYNSKNTDSKNNLNGEVADSKDLKGDSKDNLNCDSANSKGKNSFLAEILEKFNAKNIEVKLESLELLEAYNFNPLEKKIPFFKQNIGKVAQSFIAGIALGCVALGIMWGLCKFIKLESLNLQKEIQNIEKENIKTKESRTNAQNEILQLQEKLESLQVAHSANAALLRTSQASPTAFIQKLNLENHNVKIAYFGMQNQILHLLLIGNDALRILESLEAQSLGNIRGLEYYNNFIWVEIIPNVEVASEVVR